MESDVPVLNTVTAVTETIRVNANISSHSPLQSPLPHANRKFSHSPSSKSPTRSTNTVDGPRSPRGEPSRAGTPLARRTSGNLITARGATPQIRRVSSNLNPASPRSESKHSELPQIRPSITANDVAREYFVEDLSRHARSKTDVAVFVHDSCYGHRFSRPRTSKAALSTIVERPERIRAVLLGTAIAYVRLGDRHSTGRHTPGLINALDAMPPPPFEIRTTSRFLPLDHPAVTNVHGTKWMEELQIMCDTAEAKLALNGKELVRPIGYGKDESGNILPKLHEGDLYLCAESLAALQGCLGGVCDAVDTVFTSETVRRAFVCIRPPGHHCSSNFPSGFCWLNNVHVGISYAAKTHNLTHATILDFDLHHGDGSQDITWAHNQTAHSMPKSASVEKRVPIAYYSLHDINSYPCEWGDEEKVKNASLCVHNAHGQSIWNIHLESWSTLDDFWKIYESKYKVLIDKARSFLDHHARVLRAANKPVRGAIFLSAGFDASQWEGPGMQRHQVNVPTEFYARFTRDVVALAQDPSLGVDGRIVSVLEGGYSDRALITGTLSHLCGLTRTSSSDIMSATRTSNNVDVSPNDVEEASWWSSLSLDDLDAGIAGSSSIVAPKKNEKLAGNYSSPTQASTARMTDHARDRQASTARFGTQNFYEAEAFEAMPEVDWVIASHELSRLLIPSNRQTLSCRHDELNAEATRARRERQSAIGLPISEEQPMQLRTRKAKQVDPNSIRTSSRSQTRRTTIAAPSDLPDPYMTDMPIPARPRRRSSAASSILSSFTDLKIEEQSIEYRDAKNQMGASAVMRSAPRSSKLAEVKRASSRSSSPSKPVRSSKSTVQRRPVPISLANDMLEVTDSAQTPIPSHQDAANPPVQLTDMDDLASQMKKVSIKLRLPTQEQHAANRERAEQEKDKTLRQSRKPPIPRAVRTKPPATVSKQPPSSHSIQRAMPVVDQNISSNSHTPITPVSCPPQNVALSVIFNEPKSVGKAAHSTAELDHDIQRQPMPPVQSLHQPNFLTADTYEQELPLDHSDESAGLTAGLNIVHSLVAHNTASTPLHPSSTKANLPVFTSSSTIPFSSRTVTRSESPGKEIPSTWYDTQEA